MIALTVYLSSVANSSVLTTSGALPTTTGGAIVGTGSKIGTATGYGQIYALGNSGTWPALGSIGSPDGNGWLLNSTTLEGQTISAGTWTPTTRIRFSSGTGTVDVNEYQPVEIYSFGQLAFSGYISTIKEVRTLAPVRSFIYHTITCIDHHYLADKRIVAATFTNETPGSCARQLAQTYLAAEGVTIAQIFDSALYPSETLYPLCIVSKRDIVSSI